jgi:alkanesulfonate monooxygenase SsuD/methylene tetrahydromethanopterin reductase-like flavin-dependent oxidoreductase (luciferase family)
MHIEKRELIVFAALACFGLALAWTHDDYLFTALFKRRLAEARAMARDILAEAERAAQDIVASAVKIKAEADRALDEARSKAMCIQKRAQAALALAENIAKSRRMIDTLSG